MIKIFFFQLKDATNFTTTQRPVVMKELDSIFYGIHKKATEIATETIGVVSSDPDSDSSKVEKICILVYWLSLEGRQSSALSVFEPLFKS